MFTIASLWIPFTIIASLGQVARNAMQRSLTGPLGTWGATNIRFLFGFPFSIVFFVVIIVATGDKVPWPSAEFWPWLLLGALEPDLCHRPDAGSDERSLLCGDYGLSQDRGDPDRDFRFRLSRRSSDGVEGHGNPDCHHRESWSRRCGPVPRATSPASGRPSSGWSRPRLFALSAVGFRGAIITVPGVSFVTAASYALVWALFVQTLILTIYLLARAPKVLSDILGLWKPSMLAGFMGACRLAILVPGIRADRRRQCADAGAGRGAVRAGGAPIIRSGRPLSARELSGIALIVVGVAMPVG